MPFYKNIQDLHIAEKRILLRVDFNVPLKEENGKRVVGDANRIEASLDTIRYIVEQGGKVILASHLGRPDGHVNPKYSLEPVGVKLSALLNKDVILSEDCVGDGPRALSQTLKGGDVLLLENVRFHAGEESNNAKFAAQLAELGDIFVNDAFGTMHRAHASTVGITHWIEEKAIGLLVQKELQFLEPLRTHPRRPFVLIMGGAKISDKMGIIEHFLPKIDSLLIGGAMAYAFLKAQGLEVGKSKCEDAQVGLAERLIKSAAARNIKLRLPIDHVVSKAFDDPNVEIVADIPADKMGLDIGPNTIELFKGSIETAETIFWNGPLGVFEKPYLAEGTFSVARAIADSKALKTAGGGDVAAAVAESGVEDRFDFISTGGGATLEYLEGKNLPGLQALEISKRERQREWEQEE